MPHIDEMSRKYNLRTIFLSTPSKDVLDDTVNYPHLDFKFMPVTPTTDLMKKHKILQIEEGLASGVVDAGSTMVTDGTLVKLYVWYDNEWGYACRTRDLVLRALAGL